MSLDYHSPRFTFRQASIAADFPLNTLRSYFERGIFASLARDLSRGRGKVRRVCLGDVLVVAIASRLIDIGIRPVNAFGAAILFGRIAETPVGIRRRMPLQLFDRSQFETILVWGQGEAPQFLPVLKSTGEVALPVETLPRDFLDYGVAVTVLPLSGMEAIVFTRLGIAAELGEY